MKLCVYTHAACSKGHTAANQTDHVREQAQRLSRHTPPSQRICGHTGVNLNSRSIAIASNTGTKRAAYENGLPTFETG